MYRTIYVVIELAYRNEGADIVKRPLDDEDDDGDDCDDRLHTHQQHGGKYSV